MLENQTGAAQYSDHAPGDPNVRIVVPCRANEMTFDAILDTGAPWNVINPELAAILEGEEVEEDVKILIRGVARTGPLVRSQFHLLADEGDSLEVDGTFFVPRQAEDDRPWSAPNFLGLQGTLSRIRFAIDPGRSTWHFGQLSA